MVCFRMKQQIRLLGIDDSPFEFKDESTSIVGVVMRGGEYLECVLRGEILVDGTNATNVCKNMINKTRHKDQIRVVLLDGVALGGFNVVDIQEIFEDTGIPVITITRDKPDFEKIKSALEKKFDDWKTRWNIITKGELHEIKTSHNPIYVKYVGLNDNEAKEIINISTIRGVVPEPIRIAHLIASGMSRGESYGKA